MNSTFKVDVQVREMSTIGCVTVIWKFSVGDNVIFYL
jgi:hypothetical protein